ERMKTSVFFSGERWPRGVAAPTDRPTQAIEPHEVLAPEVIERMQQDELLHLPDRAGAEFLVLAGHPSIGDARDALAHLRGGDPIFLRPIPERQRQCED